MNYTIHQLQVFLRVTQTGSITKAAELLNLTQPAVSIQLKNLQDQFEIPLTEIVGRKLYVTDFGREIAAAAENILNQVYAINFKTMAHKGQLSGRLKLSAVSTGKYIIPFYLQSFLKQHPGVELSLDVTNRFKVLESLERNEIDFALVSIIPDQFQLSSISLLRNKLFLMKNPKYFEVAACQSIHDLKELPIIFREKGSGTRMMMERFFSQNDLNIVNKIELTSNEAVKQAVVAGLGVSILPMIGVKNELLVGDLKIIDVPKLPLETDWNLIWLQQKNLSPVAEAFRNFISTERHTIFEEEFSWTL
ncbi:LysR family transcriptional regulator [Flavobacterium aurantiibacter]|uniref:LysR family transcriptional regulator n=1 Tax=Flavobacterium aurantiibacter TaxID=2023067 RepID=A0A255ZVJ0_9FLAO|nr:LysR family transcriptional regulator [Flavobacterium aurantiibacter]OYQ45518.1 LysR family transcriptional regulator [Flavobacterium aurantiibacter]